MSVPITLGAVLEETQDRDGKPVTVASLPKADAYVVDYWASWCSPCRTETPLLERTWAAQSGRVVILGVASKDLPDNSLAFMKEFGMTYPNVFDSSGEIRARLGLRGFPTTLVFGADGRLRTTIVGGLTEQRLAAILEDLRT